MRRSKIRSRIPAIELTKRAIEEDPLEVWVRMNLHAYLQSPGREDEALAQLKKVLEQDANQAVALVSMAMIYADKGDLPEALKIARVRRWRRSCPLSKLVVGLKSRRETICLRFSPAWPTYACSACPPSPQPPGPLSGSPLSSHAQPAFVNAVFHAYAASCWIS
jgi:hypothetical protein